MPQVISQDQSAHAVGDDVELNGIASPARALHKVSRKVQEIIELTRRFIQAPAPIVTELERSKSVFKGIVALFFAGAQAFADTDVLHDGAINANAKWQALGPNLVDSAVLSRIRCQAIQGRALAHGQGQQLSDLPQPWIAKLGGKVTPKPL